MAVAPLRVYVAAVDGSSHPSDTERELRELRARAYGPDPEIGNDPEALARLSELEAVHGLEGSSWSGSPDDGVEAGVDDAAYVAPGLGAAADGTIEPETATDAADAADAAVDSEPARPGWWQTLWRRATATRARRIVSAVGAGIAVAAVLATTTLMSVPRPDATLRPTGVEADNVVRSMVTAYAQGFEIDASTLRAYGSYRDMELWFARNAFESRCLLAVQRERLNLAEWHCVPTDAQLFIDVSSWGDGFDEIPGQGVARFMLRDDMIDVYLYLLPEAEQ